MQERRPAAEPADWERALEGVDFPVAKDALIRKARDHGGIDREVIDILERLSQDEYETRDQLIAEARELYLEHGYPASTLPI
jgi:hypothetical protein